MKICYHDSKRKRLSSKTALQPVDKPKFFDFGGKLPPFCFSGDMCVGKTPYKRKPLIIAVFKGAWVVLAGGECSQKIRVIFCERHSRQERVDFFDTINFFTEKIKSVFFVRRFPRFLSERGKP